VKQLEVNGIAENITVIIYSDAFNTLETKNELLWSKTFKMEWKNIFGRSQ
jgi:hypothetical protein